MIFRINIKSNLKVFYVLHVKLFTITCIQDANNVIMFLIS